MCGCVEVRLYRMARFRVPCLSQQSIYGVVLRCWRVEVEGTDWLGVETLLQHINTSTPQHGIYVVPYQPFKWYAFGLVNARRPAWESVAPIPECRRPLQGNAALTRSQQFQ